MSLLLLFSGAAPAAPVEGNEFDVNVPKVWQKGVSPLHYTGNGLDVLSRAGTLLASYANMLAGRRKKVLLCTSRDPSAVVGASSGQGFQGGFRTSPFPGVIIVEMVILPADDTSNALDPRMNWHLDVPGLGGAIDQPTIHVGRRKTAAAVPADFQFVTQRWDGRNGTTKLAGNTAYWVSLLYTDKSRVLSAVIYEEPVAEITLTPSTPTTDGGVDPEAFHTGAPILKGALDDVQDTLHTLWKQQRPHLFSWGCVLQSGGTADFRQTVSATYVNIFDASFTDWHADAPGFWVWPQYHDAYKPGNHDVPVEFMVYWQGTGVITFRTAAGVDLATITKTIVTASVDTVTAVLDGSHANDKIDVLFKDSGTPGFPITIFMVAGYEYLA